MRPFSKLALFALAGTLTACAGSRADTRHPGADAPWIDDPLHELDESKERERLQKLREKGNSAARLARLDRLIDLVDAARFGRGAAADAARRVVWDETGGVGPSRGPEATSATLGALLGEAWAIEDADQQLPDAQARFLADAIAMLSVDVNPPEDADSLAIRTLAQRGLADEGHPRIADNARWRLVDHVRGVFEAAVKTPPPRRFEIAVHALYAEHEDLHPWLDDAAPHARPPLPRPEELAARSDADRSALAEVPRWASIVAARAAERDALRQTLVSAWPSAREGLALPALPRGRGHAESFAPLLRVEPGAVTLRPGVGEKRSAADPKLDEALAAALASDGRGALVMAVDPATPSTELYVVLKQVLSARASSVEIAVAEPRLDDEGEVLVVLPMQVIVSGDSRPGARALREARIHLHATGRGVRAQVDGRWSPMVAAERKELDTMLERLRRAYPRERTVALSLAGDANIEQLVTLLDASTGGIEPRFIAAGWLADQSVEVGEGDGSLDSDLERRAGLGEGIVQRLDQPFPLAEADQDGLERRAKRAVTCAPELESKWPRQGLSLELSFDEGKLEELKAQKRGKKKSDPRDAVVSCVREQFEGFRLREHLDHIEMRLILERAPSGSTSP